MKISDIERGWLAGIADGEGCFSSKLTKVGRPYFTFRVEATSAAMITGVKRICDAIGVSTKVSSRAPKGGTKVAYRIEIGKKSDLRVFLLEITPALVTKRPEAELLLHFLTKDSPMKYDSTAHGKKSGISVMHSLRSLKLVA
jgi:hypothetical protein